MRPFGSVTRNDIENKARVLRALSQEGGYKNLLRIWDHRWLAELVYYYIDIELCDLNLHNYLHLQREVKALRYVLCL